MAPNQPLASKTHRPPSVRRIGLPVRVMVMSDSMRLPATFGAVFAAKRAAERETTILLTEARAILRAVRQLRSVSSTSSTWRCPRTSTLNKWILGHVLMLPASCG